MIDRSEWQTPLAPMSTTTSRGPGGLGLRSSNARLLGSPSRGQGGACAARACRPSCPRVRSATGHVREALAGAHHRRQQRASRGFAPPWAERLALRAMHAELPLATRVEPTRAARPPLRAILRALAPLVFAACGPPAPAPARPTPAAWRPTDLDVAWIGH